ncbi:MAG: HDIG domain-containing protein [Synergistaceae bacterium]|nr:HDIG domain-containing protein [Synergistaceae bacterium]
MSHKSKPRILLKSEQNFFQRTDFSFIYKYIGPVIILLIAGVLIVLAQWSVLTRRGDSFTVGKPAPETYRVISHMRYDDQDSAENLRSMISDSIAGVTVRDVSAKSRLQRRLEAFRDLKDAAAAKNSSYLSYLPEAFLKAIYNLNPEDRARIINLAYQVGSSYIDRLESEKVYRGNNPLVTSILWEEINKTVKSPSDANFVYQILAGLGNLNFRLDDDLTKMARQAAADQVPVLDRRLEPGDVIINRGELVTEQTAMLLRLQGYTEDVFPFHQLCVVIVCVLALPLWLDILKRGAGEHKPSWWCAIFIIITAWLCEAIAAMVGVNGAGTLTAITAAFLCVSDHMAFSLAVLATLSGVFVIAGLTVSNLILLASMAIFTATIGFYLLRNLESRRQAYRRVLMTASIMLLLRMTMRYIQGPPLVQDNFRLFIPLGEFWQETFSFFIFEVFNTHLIIVMLPFFEEYIGTLSILTLREVSYPSSPLLRDLQRNAPGTYQHSLTIATLIEAVGMKLGMDVNLLRAGAYYHDIGKLRKPHFFVENQGGGVNTHDEMSPKLSSMTIISHVRDGLELAWEARLPKRIRDFIAEHHGTTCTRYFYNKAVAMNEKIEWEDFCYPGPKPQSRETALLMITDSVEAAVRAANIRELEADDSNSNREKGKAVNTIKNIVNQVIQSKANEGQFDEVNFTMKDLTLVKETLIEVLVSMYHTRKVKKIERKK